jgi:two-component system sensor histidine kinase TctE
LNGPTKPATLRRQLLLWLVPPLLVLWAISTNIDYDIAKRFVNLAYDRALLDAALDIGRQVRVVNDRIYVDLPKVALDMLQTAEHDRIYYRVTGPGGEYISGEPDLPAPESDSERVSYADEDYLGKPIRMVAVRVPVQPGSGKGAITVQVAEPVTVRTRSAREVLLRMSLPQVVLIYLAAVAVWYGVRRGLAPLAKLRHEIQSRSDRDLSPLPMALVPEEVQPLIHAMNELLQRLSHVMSSQQRFVADAAHQLRTPVAGIKTQTELALRLTDPAQQQQVLQQLHTATTRLSRLIHQLLALARTEPGAQAAHAMEPVDLGREMREATSEWVPTALQRSIDLGFEGPDQPVMVRGNAILLREMLGNLLDNAIRYSPPGSRVTVQVVPEGNEVMLQVEDNGIGIPREERDRVFERFYRLLGTETDGCGLGLAIVREVAQAHRATISLDSAAGGRGTAVMVRFPTAA